MFFRIVKTNYKQREYQYLKLLESYRVGDKSKQRRIMNLANMDHLPEAKINNVLEILQEVTSLGKSMREYGIGWGRNFKTSLLFALERCFNPSGPVSENVLKRVFLTEKQKYAYRRERKEDFQALLQKTICGLSSSKAIFLLVRQLDEIPSEVDAKGIFVFYGDGFPLEYKLSGTDTLFVQDLIKQYRPDFFLTFLCEKSYNAHILQDVLGEKGDNLQQVYLHRQVSNWMGKTVFSTDKYYLKVEDQAGPKDVEQGISVLSESIEHLTYVTERMAAITHGSCLPCNDLVDIFWASFLFKKIILSSFQKEGISFSCSGGEGTVNLTDSVW